MIVAFSCLLLTLATLVYIFWLKPEEEPETEGAREAYLLERRETAYENLRDLNFERKAGKLSESDYQRLRAEMEDEAAAILNTLNQEAG